MSVASGRGIRTKRPSTKALEAGQHPEEELSQVAEQKGMPSMRLSQPQPRLQLQLQPRTTAALSSAERGKRWREKLKLDAEADPDGPSAITLKAQRVAATASEAARRKKRREDAEADPDGPSAITLKAQRVAARAGEAARRKKRREDAEANPLGKAAEQLKAKCEYEKTWKQNRRKAALSDPESNLAKMEQRIEECKGMRLFDQAQVFASSKERIWKVIAVHGPCVLREWPRLVRLGSVSSLLAEAFEHAGQRCRERVNYNGTGKMARAGIVSRGGSYDHLLAVIGAMAEDDIPVPSSGSLYGTVSNYRDCVQCECVQ